MDENITGYERLNNEENDFLVLNGDFIYRQNMNIKKCKEITW